MPPRVSAAAAAFVIAASAACDLAPPYQAPVTATPAAFKEAAPKFAGPVAAGEGWRPALPQDAAVRGGWWLVFGDPVLNGLEARVSAGNEDLKAAIARLDQARAVAEIARSAYFPTLSLSADPSRERLSKRIANTRPASMYNDFSLGGTVSYELDLWGRIHNSVANARDLAQASAGDLAALDLGTRAELAMDYFSLRGDDAEIDVLDRTTADYQKAYNLTLNRFHGGAAVEADVDQAETQLDTARTQAADTRLKRAQLEHAIAILVGVAPAQFKLAAVAWTPALPVIPVGVPTSLLERRPDIAAAERRAAAANAEIGVARAALYPNLTLSADLGVEAEQLGSLFSLPARFWSLGAQSTYYLFDAGQRNAITDQARAEFDEAADNYRETVLRAYGEVEDNLAALRLLASENETGTAAAAAAKRAAVQAQLRYTGGIVTYLEVVSAQNAFLQAELTNLDVTTRRMNAGVALVKALGGGWVREPDLGLAKVPTRLAQLR